MMASWMHWSRYPATAVKISEFVFYSCCITSWVHLYSPSAEGKGTFSILPGFEGKEGIFVERNVEKKKWERGFGIQWRHHVINFGFGGQSELISSLLFSSRLIIFSFIFLFFFRCAIASLNYFQIFILSHPSILGKIRCLAHLQSNDWACLGGFSHFATGH